MTFRKIDWFAAGWLGLLFFGLYLPLGLQVAHSATVKDSDLMFGADAPRVVQDLAIFQGDAEKGHWRTAPHPIFVILLNPIGVAIAKFTGPANAAGILCAVAGGLTVSLAYAAVLFLGLPRTTSALLAILLGSSGSHIVFAAVPETYIFSAAVLMFLMLILQIRPRSLPWFISAGALALGVLVTNFAQAMVIYAASLRPWPSLGNAARRCFIYAAWVLAIIIPLNIAQRFIYPGAGFFFMPARVAQEGKFVERPHTLAGWLGRTCNLTQTMTLTNFVIPEPIVTDNRIITLDSHSITHLRPAALAGAALVAALWVGSIYMLLRRRLWRDPLVWALLLCLAFNFLLHMLYGVGPELYLYSCDWTGLVLVFWARCWRDLVAGPRSLLAFNAAAAVLGVICLENSVHFVEVCVGLWK